MRTVVIKSPVWKTRSVGVADYKVTDDLLVNISYKDKTGAKLFNNFVVKKDFAKKCPIQRVGSMNLALRIIPIPPEAGGQGFKTMSVRKAKKVYKTIRNEQKDLFDTTR